MGFQVLKGLRQVNVYNNSTVKPVLKWPLKKKTKKLVFKTDYHFMQVKSIAECSKRAFAILLTFIKLPFVFNILVLSILSGLKHKL